MQDVIIKIINEKKITINSEEGIKQVKGVN